jgi:hypothetical protein
MQSVKKIMQAYIFYKKTWKLIWENQYFQS